MPPVALEIAHSWYDFGRKWFSLVTAFGGPVTFCVNAPFGRFTLSRDSFLLVDGIKSWIIMELVSPLCFTYMFMTRPLGISTLPTPFATKLLAGAYFIHYLNRAVLSPLRTPSRSKSHISVPLAAVLFNLFNGSLLGAYLSSPSATAFLTGISPLRLYGGLAVWALGFLGNLTHDEILLNIRRKAKTKGKAKDEDSDPARKNKKEHYDVPHGLLYKYISFPNYFCEWVEWLGYAVAAAPIPSLAVASVLDPVALFKADPSTFSPSLTPPWIFLLAEVMTMFPRAMKGHWWYQRTFPHYPKERRAVVPFVL